MREGSGSRVRKLQRKQVGSAVVSKGQQSQRLELKNFSYGRSARKVVPVSNRLGSRITAILRMLPVFGSRDQN